MQGHLLRRRGLVTFAVLVACAEVAGRALTRHVDNALHVAPLASPDTSYYPFLLAGVKIAGALTLAALLARGLPLEAAAREASRVAADAVASGLTEIGAGDGPVDVLGLRVRAPL